jgi:hypothetical protein
VRVGVQQARARATCDARRVPYRDDQGIIP